MLRQSPPVQGAIAWPTVAFGYFAVERRMMLFVFIGLDVGLGGDEGFGFGGSVSLEALFEHFF